MARFANPERLSLPQAKYRVFLGGCQAVSGCFLDIFCRAESIENEGFMATSGKYVGIGMFCGMQRRESEFEGEMPPSNPIETLYKPMNRQKQQVSRIK